MEKPITIRHAELKQNMAQAINESMLPAFVVEPVLLDLLAYVRKNAQAQLQADMRVWGEAQEEQKNE